MFYRNRHPKNKDRNLTLAYLNPEQGGAVGWVSPEDYASITDDTITGRPTANFPIDEVQIYGGAHLGFKYWDCDNCLIDIRILTMYGERNGRLHIGFNQSLYIINSKWLPVDLAIYRGAKSTMHGELKVVGVTVSIEGCFFVCFPL